MQVTGSNRTINNRTIKYKSAHIEPIRNAIYILYKCDNNEQKRIKIRKAREYNG